MLKRANTWEIERTSQLKLVSKSRNWESLSTQEKIPTFWYELPPSRSRERIAWSAALHAVGLLLLIKIAAWLPPAAKVVQPTTAALITPLYLPKQETPPVVVPKSEAPPVRVMARITPPKIESPPKSVETAKVPPPVVSPPEPKKEVAPETLASAPPVVKPVPARKEIVTNTFASGSTLPATEHKPTREVQTGGFGDENGVAGTSNVKRTVTVASVGSFDLPSGAGKGNGTGGAHGAPGTVASAGFGDGVAGPGRGDHPRGTVTTAAFSNMTAAAPKTRTEIKPETTPVEILYKPKPAYTAEARQLRIQGEVLVEVMFRASGNLEVSGVARGLGHGLDEAALHAAQLIKFRPAMKDGQPYDSNAIVHIIFELAE